MVADRTLHADSILYALGPTGRYQLIHLFVISLGVLPALFQLLDIVFIGGAVEHHCARPQGNISSLKASLYGGHLASPSESLANVSVTFDECHIRVKDSSGKVTSEETCPYGFEYEGPVSQSVVSQLGLVCDKEQLIRVTQTLVFAGQGIGAMVGPFFSDRYGRKPVVVAANIALLVLGLIIAYAPNYAVFATAKFLIGSMQQTVYIPVCIYTGELFPTEYRRYSVVISTLSWSISGCIMTLVAYLMQGTSWRYLQTVLSLSSLAVIFHMWVMDESIIWLLANGKTEQLLKCIKRAARWNGKDFETVLEAGYSSTHVEAPTIEKPESNGVNKDHDVTSPMLDDSAVTFPSNAQEKSYDELDASVQKAETKMSFIHILRVRRLLINAIAMWFTWLTASMSYFTLYLMASSLAGDKFLNYLLTSLMDIPACFIFFFGFNRYGRRSVTILLYAILAIGTLTLGFLRHFTDTDQEPFSVFTLITSLVAVVGGSGCFFSIFFYLPELFPTNLRNQATGCASFFARIGAMMSPFMGQLSKVAIWLPGVVMAICASVAVMLLFLLPETKDKQLPQSIEEMESWYKRDKPNECEEKNGVAKTEV